MDQNSFRKDWENGEVAIWNRGELPNEEVDVVRDNKATHEEDFWSSWRREDVKSEKERKAEAEGKGEAEGEKRKKRRRKKRTKR